LRSVVLLFVIIAAAWIAVGAVQIVRGITLEGWELIGCIVLAAVLLSTVRWGAGRVYSLLPKRGKALCDAAGEALDTLLLVAVGVLVWHHFRTGEEPGAVVISLFVLAWIVKRARKVYNQRMGGQRSPGDG